MRKMMKYVFLMLMTSGCCHVIAKADVPAVVDTVMLHESATVRHNPDAVAAVVLQLAQKGRQRRQKQGYSDGRARKGCPFFCRQPARFQRTRCHAVSSARSVPERDPASPLFPPRVRNLPRGAGASAGLHFGNGAQ